MIDHRICNLNTSDTKILKPSNMYAPNYNIVDDGITQSLIAMWQYCKRSFVMRVNGFEGKGMDEKTNFGSMGHDVFEDVYYKESFPNDKLLWELIQKAKEKQIKRGTVLDSKLMEVDAAKLYGVLRAYFKHYRREFRNKKYFDVEWEFKNKYQGCTLKGKIDLKYRSKNNKKWLNEHKFIGRIEENKTILHLPLNFQCKFYILNDWLDTGEMATGYQYNVIRNPGNKIKQNESLDDFSERIYEICMKNPVYYFLRWESPYSKLDITIFQKELDFALDEIKRYHNLYVWPNTWNCCIPYACQYLGSCSRDDLKGLKHNSPLFQELKEGEIKNANSSKKSERKAIKKVAKKAIRATRSKAKIARRIK